MFQKLINVNIVLLGGAGSTVRTLASLAMISSPGMADQSSSVNINEQNSATLSNLYQTPLPKETIGYVCDATDDIDRMLSIEYNSISLDGLVNASSAWDIIPMRSLSETQFWFVVVAVALTPMFIFGIADGIGWFLRCTLWQHPEIASQSEGEQARDEPEPEAPST
jgi:hypothetical protein